MTPSSCDPQKWALLIGIDGYLHVRPLNGCGNDVKAMHQILTGAFKFPDENVTVLTDGAATREGILAALKDLSGRVGEHDIVVVHYSGHGSQMPDREGDEPDGMDETILPCDTGRAAPFDNRDITDDEIYLWLKDLTEKTTAITLIFDCCHSGTIVRDPFGEGVRWIEPETRPLSELPPSPIPVSARGLLDGGRDLGPSGWLPLGERYVLIAGCRRDERSFEIEEAGVQHGALTFFLSRELSGSRSGTTYRDVFEAVAPRVTSRFQDQHPQLEGAWDLEVFGVQRIEPMVYVPVVQSEGDRIVLGAGASAGMTVKSTWKIYRPGTKVVAGEKPLGIVELTAVGAVTSEGKIVERSPAALIEAGARAVEASHFVAEARMPVQVVATLNRSLEVKSLVDQIQASKILRMVESREHGEACVYLLEPRARVPETAPAYALGTLAEETWAVVGEDGELLMPPHRRSERGVVELLVRNLEKIARYRRTLNLRNDGSELAKKVEVQVLRNVRGSALEKPETGTDGVPLFAEGDYVALKVRNLYDRPLYLYVLDMGLTGRVTQVYPVQGAEDSLMPKMEKPLEIWTRAGEEINLYIPDEFPFGSPSQPAEGLETLKVFVTTDPADFRPLLQNGFRGVGPGSSLTDLLVATFGGSSQQRDAKPPTRAGRPEDWTTLQLTFRLCRRIPAAQAATGGRFF
jgi:hypothetical protein